MEKNEFKDLFNETIGRFEYAEYYINKYGKNIDKNILLHKSLREHNELNYISYHICIDEEFDNNYLEKEDLKKINYLIPIFKSIFLERLITKREKMDIIRIFILTEYEIIIYPPEDSSKISIYNTIDPYYGFYDEDPEFLFSYIYYSIVPDFENERFMIFIKEYEDFDNLIYSICIKYTYYAGDYQDSLLCFDVNFGYLIKDFGFPKTKNSYFGVITIYIADYLKNFVDFLNIYHTNRKQLHEITKFLIVQNILLRII